MRRGKRMKKSVVIGLVSSLALLMGLSGCGDKKETTTSSSVQPSEEKKVVKPTVAKPFVEGVPMQWVDVDSGDVDIVSELSGKNEITAKAQYFENSKPTDEWSEAKTGKFSIKKVSDKVYRYTFDTRNFYATGDSRGDFGWLRGNKTKDGKYEASLDAMEIDGKIFVADTDTSILRESKKADYSPEELSKLYHDTKWGYVLEPSVR